MDERGDMARHDVGGQQYDVITLRNGDATAEIWPALGGNCVRWSTEAAGELLWSPPMGELAGRPTRGGIPVLFPFPNRIRAGRFSFGNRDYQLPCNDSTQANAIHGFSPRVPWQIESLSSAEAALSFQINRDAKDSWPGDGSLTLTWQLSPTSLNCGAVVSNRNDGPFPFGLGFHPYFRLVGPDDRIQVPAADRWELVDSLPTGEIVPFTTDSDLRQPRRVKDLNLDDVYTHLNLPQRRDDGREVGRLLRSDGVVVMINASDDFREIVVFTPPHGQAVCLEPYTCPTDAANLNARGINVGWKELEAQTMWMGNVRYELGRG